MATPIETVRSMVRGMFVPPSEATDSAVSDSAATTARIVAALRHAGGASRITSSGTPAPSANASPAITRDRPRGGRAVAERDAVLGLGVSGQRVARAQLGGDGAGELGGKSPVLVELGQLGLFLGRCEVDPTALGLENRLLGVALIGRFGVTHAAKGEPAADHRG